MTTASSHSTAGRYVPGRSTVIVRTGTLSLDAFARAVCMSPELVRRLVTLGLIEAYVDADGAYWLAAAEVRRAARIQRLHHDLGLTYSGTGLVLDLLDRIDDLERRTGHRKVSPWT